MKEIAKYHNDINKIPLRNFTEKELNLFFTIICKAKNNGLKKMTFNFLELKKLANTDRGDKRLIKSLEGMNYKMLDLKQRVEVPSGNIYMFNLFSSFMINPTKKIMEVEIHENFLYMLNDMKTYTLFELEQLVKLRSSYSKNMFRILKQYRSTGLCNISIDDFKMMLCIPDTYKMFNINQRVLTPIMDELKPLFPNLKVRKIKDGRSIKTLSFTWVKKVLPLGGETKVLEISEGLNKAIEKAKKNRFISSFMTTDNIEKLLELYGDQKLIKGLYFASSEINVEVKKLTYIINSINMGLEKETKKIVIKKSKPNDLQGEEPKGEVKEELTEEIREPKKIEEYTENEVVKAMEKCFEKEGTSLKFLEDLRKKSTPIFFKTINKYLN